MSRALEDDWLAPRRTAVVDLLVEGARRGEVRSDLDHDTVADVLFAPIYDRLMFQHQQLTTGCRQKSWLSAGPASPRRAGTRSEDRLRTRRTPTQ